MTTETTLHFHKGKFNFSAGHFTIFSATKRENLHGHNYYVAATVTAAVDDNGLSLDYRIVDRVLLSLCDSLNTVFLLPEQSPHLRIEQTDDIVIAHFNDEKIPFLPRDIKLLPVKNISLEDMTEWFAAALKMELTAQTTHAISKLSIELFNGDTHSAVVSHTL